MHPGICLVIDPDAQRAETTARRMLHALQANAPTLCNTARGLGWAAAALIPPGKEPTAGGQIYADGNDVLIWSGDIFLPEAWRCSLHHNSDQKHISISMLQMLRRYGIEVLSELDGAFCGAWYNHTEKMWRIFNDRLGLIPVFYEKMGDRLLIGPKAHAVWRAGGGPLRIDAMAVSDLLRTENSTDDHTLIESVKWLEPARQLTWDGSTIQTHAYWDFDFHECEPRSLTDQADYFIELFKSSLEPYLQAHRPPMLGISGGMDSRTILAVAHELGLTPDCFTAGFSFSEDVRFGKQLAKAAGPRHDWLDIEPQLSFKKLAPLILETDGLHNIAHLVPTAAIRDYLTDHRGAVLLEGYMLGILGGVYLPADNDLPGDGRRPHQCHWAQARLHAGPFEQVNELLQPELSKTSLQRWQKRIDERYRWAPADDPRKKAEYAIISGRSGRIDVLGTALLRKDALVRNPGCDHRLLQWYMSTDPATWRGKQGFLDIIRRRYPRIARVSRTSSCGMPISDSAIRREYCWQREKLHRWWTGKRHPWTRSLGTGGPGLRARLYEQWQAAGVFELLREPSAQINEWVRPTVIQKLIDRANRRPCLSMPLMGLLTAEWMIRLLKEKSRLPDAPSITGLQFTDIYQNSSDNIPLLSK